MATAPRIGDPTEAAIEVEAIGAHEEALEAECGEDEEAAGRDEGDEEEGDPNGDEHVPFFRRFRADFSRWSFAPNGPVACRKLRQA